MIARVIIACCVATTLAHADGAALSWTRLPGAEKCIDAPELARSVEARIGEVLVTPAHASLSIEGRIAQRSGGGWRAVVAVAHPGQPATNQRAIETSRSDCRVLDASLALVVALLVDPVRAPPPPAPTPDVIIREVRVVVHEPWHGDVALRGEGEWGALSNLTGGAELAIAITPPGAWPIELSGWWDAAISTDADLAGRSVHEALAGGSIATCPAWPVGRIRIAGCAGVRLGDLRYRGSGFDRDVAGSELVPAITADARLLLPLGSRIDLVANAGIRVPLRRVELAYESTGAEMAVDAPASVALAIGIGVLARVF
ncbi:MAG TPA: hypothetical protein VGC41_08240 [Kofleriaceae bacterium]